MFLPSRLKCLFENSAVPNPIIYHHESSCSTLDASGRVDLYKISFRTINPQYNHITVLHFVSLFLSHITKASRQCLVRDNMRQCRWHPDKFLIVFCSLKQHVGLTGGLARVQLCWILAKYSPLHRLGGVFFFVASIRLPSCSLRNMISFVHRHVYELFDHFLKIWTDFWTLTSWISLLFSHSCLKCVVFFQIFSTCHLSNQEHSCLKCVPSTTRASHMER